MKLYKKRSYDVYKNNDTEKIDFKKAVKKSKPIYEINECLL